MKIQDMERITGLDRASIRFYEREGLLIPKRLENGYRDYSEADGVMLKKIKLLRRLGLSVDAIRSLQKGSGDLTKAMAQQINVHTSQIEDHKRCHAVCQAMYDDGAAFETLDAERYLKLLREIRLEDDHKFLEKSHFQEPIPKQIHPWRRYVARWLDNLLWGTLVLFAVIVLARVRPIPQGFWEVVVSVGGLTLFVPVEALLLHLFGTTPGKFILGIRLDSVQGTRLSFREALTRSARVFAAGCGCGIPYVSAIAMGLAYFKLTGRSLPWKRPGQPEEMPWDEDVELTYTDWQWKRGGVLAAVLAVTTALSLWTVQDGIKPKHRGDELTLAQFAENYNDLQSATQEKQWKWQEMRPDGTLESLTSPPANTVIVDMNSTGYSQPQLSYEVTDGILKSVILNQSWDRVTYLTPLDGIPYQIACTLLLAQDGCGVRELENFLMVYMSHMNERNAQFTYHNLMISWQIETDAEFIDGKALQNGEETDPYLNLRFCITIQ